MINSQSSQQATRTGANPKMHCFRNPFPSIVNDQILLKMYMSNTSDEQGKYGEKVSQKWLKLF